ncbi:MAG TPA: hypothetical protein VFQ77_02090 [Pseudonocardiaceae bacterium]|jgi:hypothetical protein|nr:hypothetical protein [Pseudonocardiaceae bacterium]
MFSPTLTITLPYEPAEALVGEIYRQLDATLGPDFEVVLEVEGSRGLAEIPNYVYIAAPLALVGKVFLEKVAEKTAEKVVDGIGALIRRLRGGDPQQTKSYDAHVIDEETEKGFFFDAVAARDPRAVAEMLRTDLASLPRRAQLNWDGRAACWRVGRR